MPYLHLVSSIYGFVCQLYLFGDASFRYIFASYLNFCSFFDFGDNKLPFEFFYWRIVEFEAKFVADNFRINGIFMSFYSVFNLGDPPLELDTSYFQAVDSLYLKFALLSPLLITLFRLRFGLKV
jgi:hypothetical protein